MSTHAFPTRVPAALAIALLVAACSAVPAGPSAAPTVLDASALPSPASPAPTPSERPTGSPPAELDPLRAAVAYRPADSRLIQFTDWAAMRASLGAEAVTGASPLEDKLPLMRATNGSEAFASGYGVGFQREHAATWGWDSFDLDWEATISDGAPVFVLRFRPDTDMARIAGLFDLRGFSSEPIPGATLRQHDLSPDASWIGTSEFAILNTAFLDDGRTLALSSDADAVREAVATVTAPPAPVGGLDTVLDALTGATAAMVVLDPAACVGYDPASLPFLDERLSRTLERELRTAGPLSPYLAHGIGYSRSWEPVGRIAFGYPDADTAAADVAGRGALATEGTSLVTGDPYRTSVFTVDRVAADGPAITIEAEPTGDRPARLFAMLLGRDLSFGTCRP